MNKLLGNKNNPRVHIRHDKVEEECKLSLHNRKNASMYLQSGKKRKYPKTSRSRMYDSTIM